MKKILLAFFIFSSHALLRAGGNDGVSLFDFVTSPPGPRQTAMGGAAVAAGDDSPSGVVNPAGLGRLSRKEVNMSHSLWLEDIRRSFVMYAHPTLKRGTPALRIFYQDYGTIRGYNSGGGTAPDVKSDDLLIQGAYGRPTFTDRFWSGAGLSAVRQTLAGRSKRAVLLDAGALYQFRAVRGIPAARAGVAINHWGPDVNYGGKKISPPTSFRLGAALSPYFENILLAADINVPREGKKTLHAGLEYTARGAVWFRAGYNGSYGGGNRVVFGWGVNALDIRLDYAYAGFSSLGETHHVGVTYRFGSLAEKNYEKGMDAFRREDYARAVLYFNKTLAQNPKHKRALLRLLDANELLQQRLNALKK